MRFVIVFVLFNLLVYNGLSQNDKAYFQQTVNSNIEVELDIEAKILHGFIQIEYVNNSPDILDFIYFHLYPNAYKDEKTALAKQLLRHGNTEMYWDDDEFRGFIDSLDFKVDSISVKLEFDENWQDIAKLFLNKPLKPGDTIYITTPFKVKLPSAKYSRMGYQKYDGMKYSFAISQWFPKPAVYDSMGWHPMAYLNQGEFYSEFGSFTVNIIMPQYMKLASAGNFVSREIVNLKFDKDSTATGFKHVYQLSNAHDFAWFTARDFENKSREIVLESGKKVLLQVYFLSQNRQEWNQALKFVERGVRFYSEFLGDYPYDVCTAVDGALSAGGGMEYPSITVIGELNNIYMLETTIIHEIGHNWFYGALGFNERDFPWMDEGLNTYYQTLYEDRFLKKLNILQYYNGEENEKFKIIDFNLNEQYYYSWLFMARKNLSQPLSLASDHFSSSNYAISAYYKSALIFRYLRNYLGNDEMDSLMRGFYAEWKFKHPQPEHFIAYFKTHSTKSLNWFFDDFLFSTANIDYKIKKLSVDGDSVKVKIVNQGQINSPFIISSHSESDMVLEEKWIDGFSKSQWVAFSKDNVKSVKIDANNQMPDVNRNNNVAPARMLFPTSSPKRIAFGYAKPFNGKDYLFLLPAVGFNLTNKFMIGAMAYNDPIVERKWSYQFVPLYSSVNKSVNGEMALFKNFYSTGRFRKIMVGISGRKYDYKLYDEQVSNPGAENNLNFYRLNAQADFFVKMPSNNPKLNRKLSLRVLHIAKQMLVYSFNNSSVYTSIEYQKYNMLDISYLHRHNRSIYPYDFEVKLQANEDIIKGQVVYNQRINYGSEYFMDIRLFAGNFFMANPTPIDYSFKMSGWTGADDYLFDYTYFSRNDNLAGSYLNSQMIIADGGFAILTPLGRSWTWIAAANITSHLPYSKFLQGYCNIGYYPNVLNNNKPTRIFEAGFKFTFFNHQFEFFLPILMSNEIIRVADLNGVSARSQGYRFVMRMDLLNPFKVLREMDL